MRYDYEKLESMLGKEFLFSNRDEKENSYKAILISFTVFDKGISYFGADLEESYDTISEIKKVEVSLEGIATGECEFCGTTTSNFNVDPYASDIEGDNRDMFICEDCYDSRAEEC